MLKEENENKILITKKQKKLLESTLINLTNPRLKS